MRNCDVVRRQISRGTRGRFFQAVAGVNGAGVSFAGGASALNNAGVISGDVLMGNFANCVTLATNSTITGALNMSANAGTTLVLNGFGSQSYSTAVGGATTFQGNLVKRDAGTWTLDQTFSYSGGTAVNAGKLIIGAKGALPVGDVSISGGANLQLATGTGTTTVTSLNILTGGILDVGNNTLKINYGSPGNDPVATVVSYLKIGYSGGAWTGTSGIISTSAQTQTSPALSVGYADGNADVNTPAAPNQVLVKYTLAGDAKLDGLVNFDDLVAVVQNFNKSGTDWAHGDFYYGISTNFTDLVAVVQNFNKVLTPAGSAGETTGGSEIGLVSSTDVQLPEPCVAGMALGAASLLVGRRGGRK